MRIDRIFDWRFKLIFAQLFGRLPFFHEANYLLRRHIIKSIPWPLEPHIQKGFPDFYREVTKYYMSRFDVPMNRVNCLEIGPGEHLVDALLFYLSGAEKVNVADIGFFIDYFFVKHAFLTAKKAYTHIIPEREQILDNIFSAPSMRKKDFIRILGDIGINYFVSDKPRYSDFLGSSSVDIVFSEAVLEHVPEPDLKLMLLNLREILKPNGIVRFDIDLRDHYASYKNCSEYNYLGYSDFIWEHFCNTPMLYQNRLTADEYYQLFADSGFSILYLDETVGDNVQLEQLKKIKINDKFMSFPFDRLAVRRLVVILKKD